jgi:hypothetical protein
MKKVVFLVSSVTLAASLWLCWTWAKWESEQIVDSQAKWDATVFQRDQPRLRRLLQWDGKVIIEADRLYSLDVKRGMVFPLVIPGAQEIIGLANGKDGQALALCRSGDELCLLAKKDGKCTRQRLPDKVRQSANQWVLCADRHSVVLLSKGQLFRFGRGRWEQVQLKPRPETPGLNPNAEPTRIILAGEKLFLGYDEGEWGGGLLMLDVKSGEWDKILLNYLPVRDIQVAPDESVWMVEGLAHLGWHQGVLHTYDGKVWKVFCESSKGAISHWNLPPTSLDAVSFDANGRPYILSGDIGLARHDGREWTLLTPAWPKYLYVSSLLVLTPRMVVIGTYDAGVMLVNVQADKVKRVVLRPSRPRTRVRP